VPEEGRLGGGGGQVKAARAGSRGGWGTPSGQGPGLQLHRPTRG
jgi:hypothetical protein